MSAQGVDLRLVQQTQIGLNQSALDEWIEYRRKYSKKPMSQPAVDKAVNKLLSFGSESEQQRMDLLSRGSGRGLGRFFWKQAVSGSFSRYTIFCI